MIYLDNAATTQVHPEVLREMLPYLQHSYGNPSSIHSLGREARGAIESARRKVAAYLGVPSPDVIFTSGGTEANHSALLGTFLASSSRKHIVTSTIEHHAILDTCRFLETLGARVTYVHPDSSGVVSVSDVEGAIADDTFCVSIMAVNNELGSIQPIFEIAQRVKEFRPDIVIHSDMIQAAGGVRLNLHNTAIDLASISAHKIHGPKGVGALYVRTGTPWMPVIHGGSQEKKRRAGTESVASVVGFGHATHRMAEHWDEHLAHLQSIKHQFIQGLKDIDGFYLNSNREAAPSIVNIGFHGVRSDTLLMRLDLEGVMASAGSACTAGSLEPSHVLLSCGIAVDRVLEAIRFSFSDFTTDDDIRTAVQIVQGTVAEIRRRV